MSLWAKRKCRPDPASPHAGMKTKKLKPLSPPITKYFERRPLAVVNSSVKQLGGLKKRLNAVATGIGPSRSQVIPVMHKGIVPIEEEWLVLDTPTKDKDEIQLIEVEYDWQLVPDTATAEDKSLQGKPKSSKIPGRDSSLIVISPAQPSPQSQRAIVINDSPPPPNVLVDLMAPTPKRMCIDLTDSPIVFPDTRAELDVVPKHLSQKSSLHPNEPSERSALGESQPVPLITGDTSFPRDEGANCDSHSSEITSRARTRSPKLDLRTCRRPDTTNSLFSPIVLCEKVQVLKVTSHTPPGETATPAARSLAPASPLQTQDDSAIVARGKEGVAKEKKGVALSSGPPAGARSPPTSPSVGAGVQLASLVKEWRGRSEGDAVSAVSLENQLEVLLWERGVPYIKGQSQSQSGRVQVFTATQNTVVENIMENGPSSLSLRLLSVVDCLSLSTSSRRMPKASLLHRLWEMIWDPHMVSNHVSHDSLLRCIQYFHTLLLFHPPGQHGTVDAVYAEFVGSLGPQVGTFAAWDEIDCLIRGSSRGHSAYMFAFLVDLLLSDFWVWLNRGSSLERRPLFVRVFWQHDSSSHITLPIRKLLDTAISLLAHPHPNEMERTVLDGVLCLLGLVLTNCSDLSTEVKVALRERASLIPLY